MNTVRNFWHEATNGSLSDYLLILAGLAYVILV